jgi:hypothetical protein
LTFAVFIAQLANAIQLDRWLVAMSRRTGAKSALA